MELTALRLLRCVVLSLVAVHWPVASDSISTTTKRRGSDEYPRSHSVDSIAAGLPDSRRTPWNRALGVSMTRYQYAYTIACALIGLANLAVVALAVAGSRDRTHTSKSIRHR